MADCAEKKFPCLDLKINHWLLKKKATKPQNRRHISVSSGIFLEGSATQIQPEIFLWKDSNPQTQFNCVYTSLCEKFMK